MEEERRRGEREELGGRKSWKEKKRGRKKRRERGKEGQWERSMCSEEEHHFGRFTHK